MAEFSPVAASPLAAAAAATINGQTLSERAFVGKILLRLNPADDAVVKTAEDIIGLSLPQTANRAAALDGRAVLWLGPDEWMIWCNDEQRGGLYSALLSFSGDGQTAAVNDVSDYYTILRLQGAGALRTLAHACPLDLHPAVFRPGECAQSRYGRAAVLLYLVDDRPTVDIQVRWSFAAYARDYLQTAMEEEE